MAIWTKFIRLSEMNGTPLLRVLSQTSVVTRRAIGRYGTKRRPATLDEDQPMRAVLEDSDLTPFGHVCSACKS